MSEIRPFRALHPQPEQAARVASVPYDVVSTPEARALAQGNEDSFLHVTRPEIDMPEGTDPHSAEVYAQGRSSLEAFRERGVLVRDEAACIYLYRLTWEGQAQTGIVAAFSVEEYDTDRIKKHEFTRPDKEEDRTVHMLTLGAQPGPVFLTFRPDPEVRRLMNETTAGDAWIDFTAPDGVRHTLWRMDRPEALVDAFRVVDPIYVADGHHRSASASNARRRLGGEGELGADHPAQAFLAVAFPSDEVRILSYNRLVQDLGGRSPDAFLSALRESVTVDTADDGEPTATGDVRMYLDGRWYRIDLATDDDDPVEQLGTQMLQRQVLEPLLGIEDQRTDPRIAFVGGIRGTAELVRRVDAGEAQVAFAIYAVTPDELLAVADAGRTMPPKSTWFEPKLRSGLFTYLLEDPR